MGKLLFDPSILELISPYRLIAFIADFMRFLADNVEISRERVTTLPAMTGETGVLIVGGASPGALRQSSLKTSPASRQGAWEAELLLVLGKGGPSHACSGLMR